MTETRHCPDCGSEIPPGSPAGVCPQCLLRAGLNSQSEAGPDFAPTQPSHPPAPSAFVPPTVEELAPLFPQLEILELLGKGGMGAVYKARQPGLDRLVAIKILPPEISRDPAFAERFQREARALARLSHPHIVAVYDFGTTEASQASGGRQPPGSADDQINRGADAPRSPSASSLCYIVMEFVDGANLRQTMRTGTLTSAEALAIVPQICEALQFAHDEGIVHRDIKPENILIDKRGRVKIADFGLAKLMANGGRQPPGESLTATHQVMGTLRYMAPEQLQGSREVDHRADIYSLGVVFYELLTGELPMGKFAPPSKKVQIDVRLDEIVLRALEQEPELRYQHASEVKTDVETISRSPSVARPESTKGVVSPTEPTWETWWFEHSPASRKMMTGVLLFVAILFLIILVSFEGQSVSWSGASSVRIGFGDPWFQYKAGEGSQLDLLSWSFGIGVLGVLLLFTWFRVRRAERDEKTDEKTGAGPVLLPGLGHAGGTPLTQIRFAVSDSCDVARQAIFHFSSLGYQLIEQHPDACVFQRGGKWGGLWETDIRKLHTILTVRTAPAISGTQWVSCDWSVRVLGAWVTKRDIRQLEAEGRGLETLLGGPAQPTGESGTGSVSLAQLVQGPADCLLLAAGIAFVTACGVALWLGVSASLGRDMTNLTNPMIRGNLTGMSVGLAIYSVFVGLAGLMLRRLRARLCVLLVAVIVGLFFPAVCALNVVMELRNMPVWPVVIPLWLGVPAALWVVVTLFRDDVRRGFGAARAARQLAGEPLTHQPQGASPRLPPEPDASAYRLMSQRPKLVPVLATFNLIGAILLMLVSAMEQPPAFTPNVARIWQVWETVDSVLGFAMAAGMFAASIGLFLWKPWARKLTLGVCVFGLAALVFDMPYLARFALPDIYAEIQHTMATEGVEPEMVDLVALLSVVLLVGVMVVVGVAWLIGQLVYFTRPRVVAAFVSAEAAGTGSVSFSRPIGPEQISLWAAISGVVLPALLLLGGTMLSNRVSIRDGFLVVCFLPGVGLELVAFGCGLVARGTKSGKAGLIISSIALVLCPIPLTTHLNSIPTRDSTHNSHPDAISESTLASLPPLGTITSGIGAEFTVPAGQVAVFEIVTRRDNETVPAPPHCGFVMAPPDSPVAGTFRWSPKLEEDIAAGRSRKWSLEIVTGGGGRGYTEGILLPVELNAAVGSRGLTLGLLEPNEEAIHWGTDVNDLPANGLIGLRVTVVAHGLKTGGSGNAHIDWKKAQSATSTTRRKLPEVAP